MRAIGQLKSRLFSEIAIIFLILHNNLISLFLIITFLELFLILHNNLTSLYLIINFFKIILPKSTCLY